MGHVLNRRFFYSEGVQEFVEVAGAYWLLDLMATKACLAAALAWQEEGLSKNRLLLQAFSSSESAPSLAWVESLADPPKRLWESVLGHPDFPEGRWELRLCVKDWHPQGVVVVCTLPSESCH
jgi:hypothetical protein